MMQVSVQNLARTPWSRSSAGAEWLGVQPPGRPAERGHVHARRRGHLAKRPEPLADLVYEQLGLLPGGKMPALVELVVVDEIGIGLLRPTPRHLIKLVRKDAHGYRDGNALRVEEAELVFPIETSRRDPRVRQPVV